MIATSPDLGLLQVFVAVADDGSLTRAAKRLGVTKGTVSRSLTRLEHELGAALLHRSSRKVALNTFGRGLYERTAPHVRALGAAIGTLPRSSEEPEGELRITAPHDVGQIVLPALLADFARRYPLVSFDLRIGNTQIDLVDEQIDVAIRASRQGLESSGLKARRVGSTSIGWFAAPGYVARRGTPSAIADRAHQWIVFGDTKLPGTPRGWRPSHRSDDFLVVRELVRAEMGIAALPGFLADPMIRAGELVAVLPHASLSTNGGLFIVHSALVTPSVKVRRFCDFAYAHLRANL